LIRTNDGLEFSWKLADSNCHLYIENYLESHGNRDYQISMCQRLDSPSYLIQLDGPNGFTPCSICLKKVLGCHLNDYI
jgi:hypothetical protein